VATTQVRQLRFPGMPVGLFSDADFDQDSIDIEESSTIYIFSDGAYEIPQQGGKIWGLDAFIDLLTDCSKVGICNLEQVLLHILNLSGKKSLNDDFSLLKFIFN
jgi:sigma-B regulation protein RsbU (phosphoserine phosphatase)